MNWHDTTDDFFQSLIVPFLIVFYFIVIALLLYCIVRMIRNYIDGKDELDGWFKKK